MKFALLIIAIFTSYSAILGQRRYAYVWSPNPTKFIKSNKERFFTFEEYSQLVQVDQVDFVVLVNKQGKLLQVEYDEISHKLDSLEYGKVLDDELSKKVADVLIQNITLTKFNDEGVEQGDTMRLLMSLYFYKRDRAGLKSWRASKSN